MCEDLDSDTSKTFGGPRDRYVSGRGDEDVIDTQVSHRLQQTAVGINSIAERSVVQTCGKTDRWTRFSHRVLLLYAPMHVLCERQRAVTLFDRCAVALLYF